jgi:flagellar biosynthetic protein FliS
MYGGVNGHDRYLETAVETASPARLIVMLYDGAIRFINEAAHAMRQRDYEAQNAKLQRAQKILAELISSLDFDKGGEIAENLFRLYTYMYNQLVEANINDQPRPIGACGSSAFPNSVRHGTRLQRSRKRQVALPAAKVSLHG